MVNYEGCTFRGWWQGERVTCVALTNADGDFRWLPLTEGAKPHLARLTALGFYPKRIKRAGYDD